jgi:hypothetical protein
MSPVTLETIFTHKIWLKVQASDSDFRKFHEAFSMLSLLISNCVSKVSKNFPYKDDSMLITI